MKQSHHIRVVLDLDPVGEPIRGAVWDGNERSQPFFGWLELASTLEAMRQSADETRIAERVGDAMNR